jgi:hypothetical protein
MLSTMSVPTDRDPPSSLLYYLESDILRNGYEYGVSPRLKPTPLK